MGVKALLDVSILISASVYHDVSKDIGFLIKHFDYDVSKTLLNYFEKNSDKKIGICTDPIIISARNQIKEAVNDTIEQKKQSGVKFNEKELIIQLEVIATSCIDRLEKNISNLIIEKAFKEIELGAIRGNVLKFYYKLKREIETMDPEKRIASFLNSLRKRRKRMFSFRKDIIIGNIRSSVPPHYDRLKRKFIGEEFKKIFGDVNVLAEGVYLKRKYASQKINVILVSNDHHFVAIENNRPNNFVPNEIKKRFKLDCLNPKKALEEIKEDFKIDEISL